MRFIIAAIFCIAAVRGASTKPTPLTPEQQERIKNWKPDDPQNIWELSGQFEGDIILNGEVGRNGLIDTKYRWPDNTLVYDFSPNITVSERFSVLEALRMYDATCVKFKRREDGDVDYVYVTNDGDGCFSSVGRRGGRQTLNLQSDTSCYRNGTVVHEFLHSLGFYHEQSSTERDDYVTIIWENIEVGKEHNFLKYDNDTITNFGDEYDYGSVMHYSAFAFSRNGEETIHTPNGEAIGQRLIMSPIDIDKLNKMYNC